ncbi:MAG: HAD family phosphatase, partial [Ilumatobacteraceae bacterium]
SLLGVDPADCIAIEDSPTGADSANAAGCTVLAVPNLVDIPQRQGRVIMSSLSPVDLATLRRMFRR